MAERTVSPSTPPASRDATRCQIRVTVLGLARSADVALASDRPVALLLPALVDLVGVDADGACGLYADDGRGLDPEWSLVESGISDGCILRLQSAETAPPEPLVADIVELMEADGPQGTAGLEAWWQWAMATAGTLTAVVGAALVAASPQTPSWHVLAAAAGLAGAASLLSRLWGAVPLAWVSGAAAVGLVSSAALAAGWHRETPRVATSAVVLGVLAVGALPSTALRAAGVARMDAQVARGADLSRLEASRALRTANAFMLGGLLACGAVVTVAASALGLWGAGDYWAIAVLAAALVTWACRIQHFPRPAQRSVIAANGVTILLGWSVTWGSQHPSQLMWVGVACVVTGVTVAALTCRRSTPLAQALARRWVRRAELVCVLSLMPLLLAQWGIYRDLLSSGP